jgi:beta-galactosidase GanA
MVRKMLAVLSLLALTLIGVPRPAPAAPAAAAHTVSYDGYSLLVDGHRVYVWGAEFHYWRLPSPDLWRDVLQKLKAGGYNAVSIYFDWAYHSPAPGVYDFTGVRDVNRLLDMASEVGIYVIARPGPYINAETDSGGFPGWVDTLKGRSRSSAPDFQAASDEWLHQIDPFIAAHQLTTGTGTVILYQIENEYGSNTDPAYMVHTEQVVRADGITVPFTHNHCCGTATWATGTGAVDLPGQDSYPQGFNCSNPTRWSAAGTLPRFRDDAPIFTPEFQGGSFDPWGGPGYDNCRQLTGADFESVFYKNNIASGATLQSFYMTYGGTSWGWLPDPSQVYTSYDYGAAITEPRQLTAKYDQAKRMAYLTQAVAPLTKTNAFAVARPTDPAITEQGRLNPDDQTQFLVLRHADSTSTARNQAHISVDLGARSTYTYDDRDAALAYTGTWSHVGAEQSFTAGDYLRTESFSQVAGDSVTVTFTGTGVRWISSLDANHGIADVYLDGTKVATVDGYGRPKATQQVFYAADGLASGAHTLTIAVTGQQNPAASGHFVVVDAIDVPPAGSTFYPSVPQQPGTAITLDGRDAKLLLANYAMGGQRLVYSTSELMTHARIGDRDVALLYGRDGQDGETVLRYPDRPQVTVLSGNVDSTWDASRGDLRLNYVHSGLARVLVTPTTGTPLLLLLGTDEQAATFWRMDTAAGPALIRGPYLVRTATAGTGRLELTGDTTTAGDVEVFANTRVLTWNGIPVRANATTSGSLLGQLAGPQPVALPDLTSWRYQFETPEAQPSFDDSQWTVADHLTTNNPTPPGTLPVLYADDYGFHHGDVWYRAHFHATGAETGVNLSAITGRAGGYAAWLNGVSVGTGGAFPAGALRPGADNVLAVLVENMGHNEDFNADETNKEPRGLTAASLTGAPLTTMTWRIQGNTGGEQPIDPVRGPMNAGGLYGQRAGWSLPAYPDQSWMPVTLPATESRPGIGWYRTTVDLHLPAGQDTSVGVRIDDDPSRHYRAEIYVNGWLIGRYINDVGPQHSFPVPAGILHSDGTNTIALAAWGMDASGGLGRVSLQAYGSQASSLRVSDVASPGYDPARYQVPTRATATTELSTSDTATPGQVLQASATFRVPAGVNPAARVALDLTVPAGWSVRATTPTSTGAVPPGGSFTAGWQVTAPAGQLAAYSFLTATARFVQAAQRSTSDTRAVRALPTPPTVDSFASDLPMVTATNGWGPVERDGSNGENAAGDGRGISVGGVGYAKGLGVHATGDVGFYLGGHCTRFTATVGADDEIDATVVSRGRGGTVAFTVLADGVPLWTSTRLTSTDPGLPVSLDITGTQQLDLVVSDGGDGNELDHGDWADARLACG